MVHILLLVRLLQTKQEKSSNPVAEVAVANTTRHGIHSRCVGNARANAPRLLDRRACLDPRETDFFHFFYETRSIFLGGQMEGKFCDWRGGEGVTWNLSLGEGSAAVRATATSGEASVAV